jgi:class 3 adenylate cyclase
MLQHLRGGTTMIDRDNRTFICSVVYYDIVDYSTKSVDVQIRLKEQLNRLTTEAIKNVAVNDRILLDTGDGAAICFLGDPEDALFVSMSLRDAILNATEQSTDDPLLVRFGINLGPVKLVNDINNRKNIIGDGVNVGQRVMSFAEPGQILVSRSYYEVVSCLTQEYAKLFHYIGMRADKHIRKHEIYSILKTSDQVNAISPAESPRKEDVQIPAQNEIPIEGMHFTPQDSSPVPEMNTKNDMYSPSSVSFTPLHWWQSKKFAYGAVILAISIVAILSFVMQKDFGGRYVQHENAPPLPSAQMKHTDKLMPENLKSSEKSISEQTESTKSATFSTHPINLQELPVESKPDSAPSPANITSEQTEPGKPASADPNMISQLESSDKSPSESAQPTENVIPDKSLQSQTPSVSNATIQFAVSPWGEVYVDGKRKGTSPPLSSVTIAPGKHRIEIKNMSLPPYSQTHEIKSNEKLKISHKF